jgi:hypothetical protein
LLETCFDIFLSPHTHEIIIQWIHIPTASQSSSHNRSFSVVSGSATHQAPVHYTLVEAGGIDADIDGVAVGVDKVVTLEAADHGGAVLEGALVVAGAGILLGDAIDVLLRPLLDGVDRQLPAQIGAVGGGTVARSSGRLRLGRAVAAAPIIDASSVGIIINSTGVVDDANRAGGGTNNTGILWCLGQLGTVVLGRLRLLVFLQISLVGEGSSCVIVVDASKSGLGHEASGREGGDEDCECQSGCLHSDTMIILNADRLTGSRESRVLLFALTLVGFFDL